MSYIRYTPANLAEASGRVLSTVNALQADHEAMNAHVRRSLADWQGSASQGHQAVQDEWNQYHEGMLHILHKLHRALDTAHQNAVTVETTLTRGW